MKKLLLILLLSSPCLAGQKYNFKDPLMNDEISNIYKDLATVLKGNVRISSVTITTATIGNLTVGTLTTSGSLGKLVQCASGNSTTNFTTTNTAFQTTNLSATLGSNLASSSNKVAIWISGSLSQQTQNNTAYLGISRGGTNITGTNGCNAMFTVTGGNTESSSGCVWFDAPGTVTPGSYAALLRVGGGTGNFGVNTETQFILICEVSS